MEVENLTIIAELKRIIKGLISVSEIDPINGYPISDNTKLARIAQFEQDKIINLLNHIK